MERVRRRGVRELERQLAGLLAMCAIPVERCDLSKPSNIRWLRRNLTPQNCPSSLLVAVIRLLAEVGRGL